jgi:arabinose-5-phosphate isomerase
MRSGRELPTVGSDATLAEALVEMSAKGMGMTAVVDAAGGIAGIFTDGDLRRCLDGIRDVSAVKVAAVMSRTPRSIGPDRLAIDCVALMETPPRVTQLLVADARGVLVGALHLHDLFRARIV